MNGMFYKIFEIECHNLILKAKTPMILRKNNIVPLSFISMNYITLISMETFNFAKWDDGEYMFETLFLLCIHIQETLSTSSSAVINP